LQKEPLQRFFLLWGRALLDDDRRMPDRFPVRQISRRKAECRNKENDAAENEASLLHALSVAQGR